MLPEDGVVVRPPSPFLTPGGPGGAPDGRFVKTSRSLGRFQPGAGSSTTGTAVCEGGGLEEPDAFFCGECSLWFTTAVGANAHRARVHGTGAAMAIKQFVARARCPSCGVDFFTRLRALQHLRPRDDATKACRSAVHAGGFARDGEAFPRRGGQAGPEHRPLARRCGMNPLSADGRACR